MDGFDDETRRCYRDNISFRSVQSSSVQIVSKLKKKVSGLEDAFRQRNALKILNESPSPMKLKVGHINKGLEQVEPGPSVDFSAYRFDSDSNILQTPTRSELRVAKPLKKSSSLLGRARPRLFAKLTSDEVSSATCSSPGSGDRLSKMLANCKIRKIMSPRIPKKSISTPLMSPRTPRISKTKRLLHAVTRKVKK